MIVYRFKYLIIIFVVKEFIYVNTFKPVLRDHLWDKEKVALHV